MRTKPAYSLTINGHQIGPGFPAYIIAELSANHGGDFERAVQMLKTAKAAGADAFKLQTFRADTITIDCSNEWFTLKDNIWAGRNLYELYEEAQMPWEWQPKLKKLGDELGIEVFSTPFDDTSVDFLENEVGVNVYKIASFEIVDIPLLKKVAATGKPVIMSTGMASLGEIDLALNTLREGGSGEIALLRCVSSYPADPDQMNLAAIPHLSKAFNVVTGLSDHSRSPAVPVTAVALGASIIEKHFTLDRDHGGPDASFSLEPDELREMIEQVRQAEAAIGQVRYGPSDAEVGNTSYRKSVFVIDDVECGERLSLKNLKVIRPGHGLAPKHLETVIGRKASKKIVRGTPLDWTMVGSK
jgi:pseudaminic acid synthase